MSRYIKLTEGWSGHHRYKILCSWMGMARMKDMNDFLAKQQATEPELHSDAKTE